MPRLVNARTGTVVVESLEIADTRASRRRGLLGRDGLDSGCGLLIRPCLSIHTAFMRFAIDVVFLDRAGRVLKMLAGLPPWRVAVVARAASVVELPSGALRAGVVALGDHLRLEGEGRP